MAGRVIQDWRRTMSGRLRSLDVETETTPRDYCRVSTELPHYSSAGCWELTKVRWQASTCRTTWMNTRFGSIAGDPRAVASSSSGLCSKRSLHLPLLTKPWSSGQSLEHYRLGQAESRGYPLTRNTSGCGGIHKLSQPPRCSSYSFPAFLPLTPIDSPSPTPFQVS